LSGGSNVICLIDSNTVLPESSGMKILSRYTEWYDGNWASNLNWKRNGHNVFNNINFSESFGFETAESSPEWIITGIPKENFSDVLAGMFIGWIHLNSGFLIQMNHSKGRLILCSFPVAENYPHDTFAQFLFQNFADYITSKEFRSGLNFFKN
jgi:hypothetical protein